MRQATSALDREDCQCVMLTLAKLHDDHLKNPPAVWHSAAHAEWELERKHGPRFDVSKIKAGMPDSLKVRYRRALALLEAEGYVETFARWNVNKSHARLTSKGLQIVASAKEQPEVQKQAGFGNRDVAELTTQAVDIEAGQIDYPSERMSRHTLRVPPWPKTHETNEINEGDDE